MLDTIDRPSTKRGATAENPLISGTDHEAALVSPTSSGLEKGGPHALMEPSSSFSPTHHQTRPLDAAPSHATARRSGRNRRSNSDIPQSIQGGLLLVDHPGEVAGPEGYYAAGPPHHHHPVYPYPPYRHGHPMPPHQQQQQHQAQHHQQQQYPMYSKGPQQHQQLPPHPFMQQPLQSQNIPPMPVHYHQQQQQGHYPQQQYGSLGHSQASPRSFQMSTSAIPPPPPRNLVDCGVPQFSNAPFYGGSSKAPPLHMGRGGDRPMPGGDNSSGGGVGAESRPLLGSTNGERERRHHYHVSTKPVRERSRRRKALSSSAADPSFGSFWNETAGPVPPPPIQQQQQRDDVSWSRSRPQKFSPRAEFRKLAKGLSPNTSPSAAGHRKVASLTQIPPGLWAVPPPIDFLGGSSEDAANLLQQQSERSQYQRGPMGRMQKSESVRKMHIRQESAQLLVQEVKGVEQQLVCRNVLFLLLFVFHLVFIAFLGQKYGLQAMEGHQTNEIDGFVLDYSNMVYIACWSGLFAVFISALLLGAMTYFAHHFVQIALFVIIFMAFAWGTIGIGLSPKTAVPVTGIIALALAVAYAFIVWDRIPFAAANLVTALSGLSDFPGIIVVAFGLQAVALIWTICFSVVVFSVYNAMQVHGTPAKVTYCVYVLLAMSLYWTFQVLQGTVHAITAGVIGRWWYDGRTESNADLVKQSTFKTIFFSMGSICFGSLFVGPVRILRLFSVLFRPGSTESSSLMCLHECIHFFQSCTTTCVDSIASRCNVWAYTYIGMYHYGFLDAGRNATELFAMRGWTTIVSDDLVPNVLFFTSLVIGGITGCFAYLLSQIDRLAVVNPKDEAGLAPFVEGVVIGLVLPSVVFGLITSSVNAVLVCFASSPLDFDRRHPQLSREMRAAWREVWPRALDVSHDRFGQVLHVDC